MANQLNCLRCGAGMQFIKREKFQLGQTGWVLGDLPNLFAGAMGIEIYTCPTHRAACRAESVPSAARSSTSTTAAARTASTNSDSKL